MKLSLEDLVGAARDTTARQKARQPEASVRREAEELASRGETGRLRAALQVPGVSLIAEVKGASPLRGRLRESFDPQSVAAEYEKNGAAAISVLTEEHFFEGSLQDLAAVSSSVALPTLRKDFVTDLYQLFRATTSGAAAVLLIAEVLDGTALEEFVEAAHSVGLDALVEFHRPNLLIPAVEAGSEIIGINNRDLDTMEVDFEHALNLAAELPPGIVSVAESAVSGPADIERVGQAGFDAALVGTALMTADSPGEAVRDLVEAGRAAQSAPTQVPGLLGGKVIGS